MGFSSGDDSHDDSELSATPRLFMSREKRIHRPPSSNHTLLFHLLFWLGSATDHRPPFHYDAHVQPAQYNLIYTFLSRLLFVTGGN